MPTLVVSYTFDSDAEGFAANINAGVVAQWQSADGDPASGCVEGRVTGKNSNVPNNDWTRQLTFEDMGVPAGSTVTAITAASMRTRCSEYNTGSGVNQSNGCVLTTPAPSNLEIEVAGASEVFTTVTEWAQQAGAGATGLDLPSDTSVQLQWLFDLRTGNSNAAAVTIRGDTITYTVTYEAAVQNVSGTGDQSVSLQAASAGTGLSELAEEAPSNVLAFDASTEAVEISGSGSFAIAMQAASAGTGDATPVQQATGVAAFALTLLAACSGGGTVEPPQQVSGTGGHEASISVASSGGGATSELEPAPSNVLVFDAATIASLTGTGAGTASLSTSFAGAGDVTQPAQISGTGGFAALLEASSAGSGIASELEPAPSNVLVFDASTIAELFGTGEQGAGIVVSFSGAGDISQPAQVTGTGAFASALAVNFAGLGTTAVLGLAPSNVLAFDADTSEEAALAGTGDFVASLAISSTGEGTTAALQPSNVLAFSASTASVDVVGTGELGVSFAVDFSGAGVLNPQQVENTGSGGGDLLVSLAATSAGAGQAVGGEAQPQPSNVLAFDATTAAVALAGTGAFEVSLSSSQTGSGVLNPQTPENTGSGEDWPVIISATSSGTGTVSAPTAGVTGSGAFGASLAVASAGAGIADRPQQATGAGAHSVALAASQTGQGLSVPVGIQHATGTGDYSAAISASSVGAGTVAQPQQATGTGAQSVTLVTSSVGTGDAEPFSLKAPRLLVLSPSESIQFQETQSIKFV